MGRAHLRRRRRRATARWRRPLPRHRGPGQIGTFALAGHRSGLSVPALAQIDRITTGSTINVTTPNRITTARSITMAAPTDVNVIAAVPGQPDATPTKPELTLVTCWPATGHSARVVVEADLTSSEGGAQ